VNVLDSLELAILVVDQQLRVQYRNSAAEAFGLPAKDSIESVLSATQVAQPFEGWAVELAQVMQQGQAKRWSDVLYQPIGGESMLWDVTSAPLQAKLEQGSSGELLVIIEDVSEQAELRRQIADNDRLASIGKLVARVAHELNNPLDGILRYINLAIRLVDKEDLTNKQPPFHPLLEGGKKGEGLLKLRGYLGESKTALVRMTRIIRELLEFSRSACGRFDQANVNDIVEEAIRNVSPQASDYGVMIAGDFQQQKMPAISSGRLLQVCTNLMKNAIDAMPEGGRLIISTGIVGENVVLRFADTGPGLPEDISRLFEPFYTTKQAGKGTGLGLAICKDLIERMNGTIKASPSPDGGAVFTVIIPLTIGDC